MKNLTQLVIITILLVVIGSAPVEQDNLVEVVDNNEAENRHKRDSSHTYDDIIAQASCSAYMPIRPNGWVYAVRRDCATTAPTCDEVCSSKYLHVQDSQTAERTTWRCIGSVHIYGGRPATGDGKTSTLGLKTYYTGYESCGGGCGPNYCCCRVL